ncbi:MAG: hypothetical protein J0L93_08335 [Deltaproteobacteria bacterium]|nr:hypothetical protein [Deltaproteobacteria bacterium]
MEFITRSLSPQESRIVLHLTERGSRTIERQNIIDLLKVAPQAADHIIRSLRRKGWLERASWGKYLLIPPEQGPDALGEHNLLALASRISNPYYIGYGTAATHYGFTTQHRNVIWLITPVRLRDRHLNDTEVHIVNLVSKKFFGFQSVDIFGYPVMMSDREKTVIDCADHPERAGGPGEVAMILATASHRLDWEKTKNYLDQIDSTPLIRRFGWLIDHVGAEMPSEIREHLLKKASRGPRTIFGNKKILRQAFAEDDTWRISLHISKEELHGSAKMARRQPMKRGT